MSTQITKKTETAITRTYDLDKPVEAVQMAVLLKNLVVQQKLYVQIKGRNYAMVEGWALAGFLTGLNVMVDEPKCLSTDKEIKYSCTAKLYKNEKLVGVGYAVCSNKESIKKSFDEYAILSMVQTRAIGKAYRNKIGFIMKIAGFQPTPSEEMTKFNETPIEPPTIDENTPISQNLGNQELKKGQVIGPDGNPTYVCAKCGDPIADVVANYSLKRHGKMLCRACQPKK